VKIDSWFLLKDDCLPHQWFPTVLCRQTSTWSCFQSGWNLRSTRTTLSHVSHQECVLTERYPPICLA
jgi:hypothetical protein